MSQRLDHGLSQPGGTIRHGPEIGVSEPPVDPADEIAIGDIPDEQEEAIGRLVEPAVAQIVGRQGTFRKMIRLGTGLPALPVAAMIEVPIAAQLRAGRACLDQRGDLVPSEPAVPVHVAFGDVVADALVADGVEQPLEQRRGVPTANGGAHAAAGQVATDVVEHAMIAGDTTN